MNEPISGNFCKLDELNQESAEGGDEPALLDRYGRNETILETPDIIEHALEQLGEELDKITADREAFDLAQVTCPDYVGSTNFRLMFLRSTEFDAKAAAKKLIKYWSRKVELFGLDKAFRKISIRDFEDEDDRALRQGGVQSIPDKDDFGRGIIVSFRDVWDNRRSHQKSMLRLIWYMIHMSVENDVKVQKNGIVIIVVNTLPAYQITSYDDKINRILWRDLQSALPTHVKATHAHFGTSVITKVIKATLRPALKQTTRERYHYLGGCTLKAFCESLEEFGIGANKIPAIIGGESDFSYQEWLQEQQERAGINDNNGNEHD